MSEKYIYVYEPGIYDRNPTRHLPTRIGNALGYSDHESGEIESLRAQLNNTQAILQNLIVFLHEKKVLVGDDWNVLKGEDNETEL